MRGCESVKWTIEKSPKKLGVSGGWFGELDKVYVDEERKYCVMSRDIMTGWGSVTHVCMRNEDSTDIPWAEKQRIKEELYGNKTAIEVFPTRKNLIDEANMYHIWIINDKKFKIPFGLSKEGEG